MSDIATHQTLDALDAACSSKARPYSINDLQPPHMLSRARWMTLRAAACRRGSQSFVTSTPVTSATSAGKLAPITALTASVSLMPGPVQAHRDPFGHPLDPGGFSRTRLTCVAGPAISRGIEGSVCSRMLWSLATIRSRTSADSSGPTGTPTIAEPRLSPSTRPSISLVGIGRVQRSCGYARLLNSAVPTHDGRVERGRVSCSDRSRQFPGRIASTLTACLRPCSQQPTPSHTGRTRSERLSRDIRLGHWPSP